MFPHTVTVYNILTEPDPSTFEDVVTTYITILRGVLLDETKGANVRRSGLEGADAATLYIPLSVEAVDGVTGAAKTYSGPMEFWRAVDKSGLWTLDLGGNTLFLMGEAVEPGKTQEYLELSHDGVYTVTKVDKKHFGGLPHWEVGGA